MAKKIESCEVELFVVVGASGNYEVAIDQEAAEERFNDEIGSSECRRLVKVTLTVPLPVEIELRGVVPAETSEGAALTVA